MKDVQNNPEVFFQRAIICEIMSDIKQNSEICNGNISGEMFSSEPERKTEE